MPGITSIAENSTNIKGRNFSKSKKAIMQGLLLAAMGSVFTLSGCATKPSYQSNNAPTIVVNERGVPNYYKVKSGDTVSQIANRYRLNYRNIGAINHLDSRYTIYAGQWLKLWEGGASTSSRRTYASSNTVRTNSNRAVSTPRSQQNTYQSPPVVQPSVSVNNSRGFGYPTRNQVIKNFDASAGVNGMWFAGRIGDPVVASQSGQVLYAGNGLPEYGNLIMIRHDNTYITVYAHNNEMLVKEGDQVQKGQRIATMGNTGQTSQVALQFQLRENGTPIDPRNYLGR